MPLYSYKAKTQKGQVITDVIQAINPKEAAATLKADGFQLLTIKDLDKGFSSVAFGGISTADKAAFCRFISTMLRAGLPISEALDILKDEIKNPKLKKITYDLSFQVRKGKTLSSVLATYKKDFDSVFLTMIKAGEESGSLDKAFDYLSKQLLATYELSQKVKGAMAYPSVIIAAMGANILVMILFVLPRISEVFSQLNVEVPFTTKVVLAFGNFVGGNIALVLGMIGIGILLLIFTFVIRVSRDFIFDLFLRAPVINKVVTELDIARFSRTLSTLLQSGVPIMVALEVSSDVMKQKKFVALAKEFGKGISEGRSLSEVISEGKNIFPSIVVQTIKAGEKSGSLEIVLSEMADFYEKEVDYNIKKLTSLLEPILMLIVGLGVGAMVIIMVTPIYNIVGSFEG